MKKINILEFTKYGICNIYIIHKGLNPENRKNDHKSTCKRQVVQYKNRQIIKTDNLQKGNLKKKLNSRKKKLN